MLRSHTPIRFLPPALLATLIGCGGGSPANPNPGSTPTPTPAAPTPTPAATPATNGFVCTLPPSANDSNCHTNGGAFGDRVNKAIDNTIAKHPELFDFADQRGGAYKIKDRAAYFLRIKAEIEAQQVCAKIAEEEIMLKVSNEWSEDWGVVTSTNYVWRRYRGSCEPASW